MSAIQAIIVQGQMSDKPHAIIMYLPARELYYGIAHTPQSPKMPITDFDVIEVLATLDAWMSAVGSEEITYYGTFDIGNQYDAWRRELFDGDSRASWEVMVMREDGSVTSFVSDAPHPIQKIFQNIRAFAERVGGLQNE